MKGACEAAPVPKRKGTAPKAAMKAAMSTQPAHSVGRAPSRCMRRDTNGLATAAPNGKALKMTPLVEFERWRMFYLMSSAAFGMNKGQEFMITYLMMRPAGSKPQS